MNIETLLSSFDQINFSLIVGEWKTWNYMINEIEKYTLYLQAIVLVYWQGNWPSKQRLGWEFKTPHSFAIKWMDGPSLGQKHSKICWLKSSTKSSLGFLELGLGLGFLIARLTGIGLVGSFPPLRFVGLDAWSTLGPNWYWFQQWHLLALFLACFPCFALAIWLWIQC